MFYTYYLLFSEKNSRIWQNTAKQDSNRDIAHACAGTWNYIVYKGYC